jgi:hypothetical protein
MTTRMATMTTVTLLAFLGFTAVSTGAVQLTVDNWDAYTVGKSVFLNFIDPQQRRCKNMKTAWDNLMKEFQDSPAYLIAEVDCTSSGRELCLQNSIRKFPTIKYGNTAYLQAYRGALDFGSLKTFIDENLYPLCSPFNLDNCTDWERATVEIFRNMKPDGLNEAITAAEKELKALESSHNSQVKQLELGFATFTKDKRKRLGLLKSVKQDL